MTSDMVGLILGVVGGVTGVGGLVAALVIYQRSQRQPRLRWDIDHQSLVRNQATGLDGVRVLFNEKPVANLSVARIAIWNDGHGAVRPSDFAEASPLTVVATGGVILSASVLKSNDALAGPTIGPIDAGETELPVTFAFFEHRKGSVIQVLHTGTTAKQVLLRGRFVGGDGPKSRGRDDSILPFWVIACVAVAVAASCSFWAFSADDLTRSRDAILAFLGGLIVVGPIAGLLVDNCVRLFRPNCPYELLDDLTGGETPGKVGRWLRRVANGR